MGPSPSQCLGRTLGFALGAGRVGPLAKLLYRLARALSDISQRAVHALAVEPGHSPPRKPTTLSDISCEVRWPIVRRDMAG